MSQVTRAQDYPPDSHRRQLIQKIEDEGTASHFGQYLGAVRDHRPEAGAQPSSEDGRSYVGEIFHPSRADKMECWNGGIMIKSNRENFFSAIIPLFHYSIIPFFLIFCVYLCPIRLF
jgi:hypothetical protein